MTGDQIIDMHMDSVRRLFAELGTEAWKARTIGEAFGAVNMAYLHCYAGQVKWMEARAELETMWEQRNAQKEEA